MDAVRVVKHHVGHSYSKRRFFLEFFVAYPIFRMIFFVELPVHSVPL